MQVTNQLYRLLLLGFISAQIACNSDVETVESKDDLGRVIRYERRKKDFAKQGLYQKFFPDGKLAEEAHFIADSMDGEHKYFYPGGGLESVEHYRKGAYHGKYQKYYENGTVQLEQNFENGALQGQSIAYYPNGTVKEKVTLVNNDENGPFSEYYENGVLKTEGVYVPGDDVPLEEGELKEYDESGTLVRIADCKQGVCLTKWKKE
jgi:antitoxin component YwqK of YwqJK toxin-antitoxin module